MGQLTTDFKDSQPLDYYQTAACARDQAELHFRELQKPLFTRLLRYIARQDKDEEGFAKAVGGAKSLFPAYDISGIGDIDSLYKFLHERSVENMTQLRRLYQAGL